MTIEKCLEIFSCGISQGLLLAEAERRQEEYGEAFAGAIFSNKFSMPMSQQERRQIHSDRWINAHRKEVKKFFKILGNST